MEKDNLDKNKEKKEKGEKKNQKKGKKTNKRMESFFKLFRWKIKKTWEKKTWEKQKKGIDGLKGKYKKGKKEHNKHF